MGTQNPENYNLEAYLLTSSAVSLNSEKFSEFMDENDPIKHLRKEFMFPKVKAIAQTVEESNDAENDCIYFCGNSLGLESKNSKSMVENALKAWEQLGVNGWFTPIAENVCWTKMEDSEQMEGDVKNMMAKLVGGRPIEVAVTASLTQNLNSLLLTFYKPTSTRHKILIESNAFPSDRYAVKSHIQFHGYDPNKSLISMSPREGEDCLRTEDILEAIEREGNDIAVILFPGIQYYTGQFLPMKEITAIGRAKGCVVGWDVAHAVGNVPLSLHDWDVDFAVWCTYKYLNAGPGAIGGLFLHERHAFKEFDGSRLAGWWSIDGKERFKMEEEYLPRPGAAGYVQSTVNILSLASLLGSLQIFAMTDMKCLRKKSILLTSYLESLLKSEISVEYIKIITPSEVDSRGSQLSLTVPISELVRLQASLLNYGVVCDKRNPNCLRITAVPLYCSFEDVRKFVAIFKKVLEI